MKAYEVMYIIKSDLGEEETQAIIKKYEDLISKNEGNILELNPLGIKELCINFHKHYQGFYVQCQFEGTGKTIEALNKQFQVDEKIIRQLIVTLDSIILKKDFSTAKKAKVEA